MRHESISDVHFVIIASRQRSSSSLLSRSIAQRLVETGAIARDFDEPWMEAPERWANRWISDLLANFTQWRTYEQRVANPLGYIRALRREFCRHQALRATGRGGSTLRPFTATAGAPKPAAPCVLTFKLFDVHLKIAAERASPGSAARRSLYTAATIAPLLSYRGSRTVVLERDALEATCSLKWANITNTWSPATAPPAVRGLYPRFREHVCLHSMETRADVAARAEHEEWFRMVRDALRFGGTGAHDPWHALNVTYDENVNQHEALMDRISRAWFVVPGVTTLQRVATPGVRSATHTRGIHTRGLPG